MARAIGPHGEILSEVQVESVIKTYLERGLDAAVEQLSGDIAYGIIEIGGLHRVIEYQFEFKGGVLCDQTGQDVRNLVQPSEELIQKIGPENIARLSDKYVNDFLAIKEAFENGGANEVFHTSDEGGDQLVVYRYYREGNAVKCSASFFHKNSTQLAKFSASLSKMSGVNFQSLAKEGSSPLIFSDRVATNELLDRAGASAGVHFNRDLSPMAVKEQMAKVLRDRINGCTSLQEVKDVLEQGAKLSPSFLKENFGIDWDASSEGTLNDQYRALYHHLVEGASSIASAPQFSYQLPMGVSVRSFGESFQLPFQAEKSGGFDLSRSEPFGTSAFPAGIGNMPALPQRLLQNHGFTSFGGLSSPTSTRSKFIFSSGERNVSGSFPGGLRSMASSPYGKLDRNAKTNFSSSLTKEKRDKSKHKDEGNKTITPDEYLEVRERLKKLFPLAADDSKKDKSSVIQKSVRKNHLFEKPERQLEDELDETEVLLEALKNPEQSDAFDQGARTSLDQNVRYSIDDFGAVRAIAVSDEFERDRDTVLPNPERDEQGDLSAIDQGEDSEGVLDPSEAKAVRDASLGEEIEADSGESLQEDLEELSLEEESSDFVREEFHAEGEVDLEALEDDLEDVQDLEAELDYEAGYDTEEDRDEVSSEDLSLQEEDERLVDGVDGEVAGPGGEEADIAAEFDNEQHVLAIDESEIEKLGLDPATLILEDELKDYLITGEQGAVLTQMQEDAALRDRLLALQMLREIALERELELLEFMMLQQRRRKKRFVDLNYFLFRVVIELELEAELEEEILALLRFTQHDLELFARLARELSSDSRIEAALAFTQQ